MASRLVSFLSTVGRVVIMALILTGIIAVLLTVLALCTLYYAVKFGVKFIEFVKIVYREPECRPPLHLIKSTGTNGKVINLEDFRKRK